MINDYKEAEKIVKQLNIKDYNEYRTIVELRFKNILPKHPDLKYKDKGWKNWMTFLGNNNLKHKCDVSLDVFRRYMQTYFPQINSGRKYRAFYMKNKTKISKRLPSRPDITYKMDFSTIFMVSKRRTVEICDYNTFINLMSKNYSYLINSNEYKELAKNDKLDPRMPHRPQHQYGKKWKQILNDINNRLKV